MSYCEDVFCFHFQLDLIFASHLAYVAFGDMLYISLRFSYYIFLLLKYNSAQMKREKYS